VVLEMGDALQGVGEIILMPIPDPEAHKGSVRWHGVDNDNIIGYSLYRVDRRLNEEVVERCDYLADGDVLVKPVIKGGYETVYSSRQGVQSNLGAQIPISYSFTISPNPFVNQTRLEYALPEQTSIEILIYDVAGRKVNTLVSEMQSPGYYSTIWNGTDDKDRKVASGVYFIRFEAGEFRTQDKILLVK